MRQQLKRLENRHRARECSVSDRLMKKLDWKSLAIGMLMTTTVIACTGVKNTSEDKTITQNQWDNSQKWDIKVLDLPFQVPEGYEPFSSIWIGDLGDSTINPKSGAGLKKRPQVLVRKRIK